MMPNHTVDYAKVNYWWRTTNTDHGRIGDALDFIPLLQQALALLPGHFVTLKVKGCSEIYVEIIIIMDHIFGGFI